MRQWVLKITDYADRMLEDLEKLPEWDDSIREMQKNWIGRSEGAEVEFRVESEEMLEESSREHFKFRTNLANKILSGDKWVTFRIESKDINFPIVVV